MGLRNEHVVDYFRAKDEDANEISVALYEETLTDGSTVHNVYVGQVRFACETEQKAVDLYAALQAAS